MSKKRLTSGRKETYDNTCQYTYSAIEARRLRVAVLRQRGLGRAGKGAFAETGQFPKNCLRWGTVEQTVHSHRTGGGAIAS